MKALLAILVIVVVGAGVALLFRNDPGYVLIGFGVWTVEMSLAVLILGVVFFTTILYFGLRLVDFLLSAPNTLRYWLRRRAQRKTSESLARGLIAESEGAWKQAERSLLHRIKESDNPTVNYLAAARVAQEQNAPERRDLYLKKAYEHAPQGDITVDLTQAELLIDEGEYSRALVALNRVHRNAPKQIHAMRLMARLHESLGEWKQLATLLPELEESKVLPKERLIVLYRKAHSEVLKSVIASGDVIQLHNTWRAMPRELQQDAGLLLLYVQALIDKGDNANAAQSIESFIAEQWDDDIVRLYGHVPLKDPHDQLAVAESWLTKNKENSALLLTLGRICQNLRLWGKARAYFETATRLGIEPEAYYYLARLVEHDGETEAAAEYYRRGLSLIFKKPDASSTKPLPRKKSSSPVGRG